MLRGHPHKGFRVITFHKATILFPTSVIIIMLHTQDIKILKIIIMELSKDKISMVSRQGESI